MPPPRKVDLLPEALRRELDDRLVKNGFGGYHALKSWLLFHGYEISVAVLQKHGVKLKRDFQKVRARLAMAQNMLIQMPDDAENALDKFNAITLRDMISEVVSNIQDFDAESGDLSAQIKLIASLSLTQSRLSRAAVNRQKWTEELRARAAAAAEAVDKIAQKSGLRAETAAEIRREILGIAG